MRELNYTPSTLFVSDNLPILRGMNSETVDLIYLDPPFNSQKQHRAPIGSKAEGQSFDDTWRWDELDARWLGEIAQRSPALASVVETARLTQGDGTAAYLTFLGVRLLQLHRVLKPTGSTWLHCDPTANSYLRISLDAVFGAQNMRNEIVWGYTGPGSPKMRQFSRKHDTLYWYAKGGTWTFNADSVRVPHAKLNTNRAGAMIDDAMTSDVRDRYLAKGKVPETWWTEATKGFSPVGRSKKENAGWATQKPLALLQRIVRATSNAGDLVLDPFAGYATCLVAAAMEGRQWVGIEACDAVDDILHERLSQAELGVLGAAISTARICRKAPKRTDLNGACTMGDSQARQAAQATDCTEQL